MISPLRSETDGSYENAADIRVDGQGPIYCVAPWVSADLALQPLRMGTMVGREGRCHYIDVAFLPRSVRRARRWLVIDCESRPPVSDTAPLAVVELTEGIAHIDLVGPAVEALLTSTCVLDMHVMAFAPDTCVRVRIENLAVVLDQNAAEEFACYAPRSHLSYPLTALRGAARSL